jgi:hypothetical protein
MVLTASAWRSITNQPQDIVLEKNSVCAVRVHAWPIDIWIDVLVYSWSLRYKHGADRPGMWEWTMISSPHCSVQCNACRWWRTQDDDLHSALHYLQFVSMSSWVLQILVCSKGQRFMIWYTWRESDRRFGRHQHDGDEDCMVGIQPRGFW